jgi:hypothetical protein
MKWNVKVKFVFHSLSNNYDDTVFRMNIYIHECLLSSSIWSYHCCFSLLRSALSLTPYVPEIGRPSVCSCSSWLPQSISLTVSFPVQLDKPTLVLECPEDVAFVPFPLYLILSDMEFDVLLQKKTLHSQRQHI